MKKKNNNESLIKTILKKENYSKTNQTDERIVTERNKILFPIFMLTIGILTLIILLADIFDFSFKTYYLGCVLGGIFYITLLAFCKKNMVNNSVTLLSFIWGIILFPVSLSTLLIYLFIDINILTALSIKIFIATMIFTLFILPFLLYLTANYVFKKSKNQI